MNTATEDTQEIDYLTCDTIEFRRIEPTDGPGSAPERSAGHRARPRHERAREMAREAATGLLRRWPRIWPPLVGALLGFSAAAGLWCLFLLWWLGA